MASPWTGRSIHEGDTMRSNAKLSTLGGAYGRGAMSSRGYSASASGKAASRVTVLMTRMPILEKNRRGDQVCNLYSITTNQAAIIALFRVINRYVGNLPPMPGVFPDYPAPVVRNDQGEREMVMMRWGMPSPPRTPGPPVTNIRNTSSPHWRMWLKPENLCLCPRQQLRGICAGGEPRDEEKGRGVVRAQ